MENFNKSYGQILKDLRRSKGISQRELAEKVGVDFTYISKIENDRLKPPAADTTIKMCQILEVSSELLLFTSGKISTEITDVITSSEEALRFMNVAKKMNLSANEWKELSNKLKKLR